MKYMIWGAGNTGSMACDFLGSPRVKCFVDNVKTGRLLNKDIISLSEALKYADDYIIVIASEKYFVEMEAELRRLGIKNFFVFREYVTREFPTILPWYYLYGKIHYMDYNEILADYHTGRYHKIAIFGVNSYTPYLISEICFQCGAGSVVALIDEDAPCNEVLGLPVLTSIEKLDDIDCLILNKRHSMYDVWDVPEVKGLHTAVIDLYDIAEFVPSYLHPELEKYKNIHKGKRCFIVATGPSLRIEDLDMLHSHHEICISVNKIYRCYDKTKWRADYVGVSDSRVYADMIKDKRNGMEMPKKVFVSDSNKHLDLISDDTLENEENYHFEILQYMPYHPKFSDDLTRGTYWGYTVTYDFALQMAAYMGFSKIYLLGVDHSAMGNIIDPKNHFISDYFREGEREKYQAQEFKWSDWWNTATKAYEAAEKYSRRHGFRIYNATRGGNLEVFERVDFDSLFDE